MLNCSGIGKIHKVGVPMHVYAMYENGRRAHKGQRPIENFRESASLYGRYAKVASEHPTSWHFGRQTETAKTIGTISKRNRMICFPCPCYQLLPWRARDILTPETLDPLLMNAFNDVNIAGACIITSTDFADRMGISRHKWIFPLGGGRARDTEDCITDLLFLFLLPLSLFVWK